MTCAKQLLATFALIIVQANFAAYQIWGKEVLKGGVNPVAFALLRELSSSVVFVVAATSFVKREHWPSGSAHICRYIVCGASMFGTVFLMIVGLQFTSASVVALLQPTQPVWAAALAAIAGQERMGILKAIGILVCCCGSALVALANGGKLQLDLGSVVILLQCLSGANYVVQQRPLLLQDVPPLVVACCSYVIATALTVMVGLIYLPFHPEAFSSEHLALYTTPSFAGFMLFAVLCTTVYNYVAIAFGTKELGATLVTLFLLLQGIFGCLFEWVLYQKCVSTGAAIGGLVLAIGLSFVLLASRRRDHPCPTSRASSSLREPLEDCEEVPATRSLSC